MACPRRGAPDPRSRFTCVSPLPLAPYLFLIGSKFRPSNLIDKLSQSIKMFFFLPSY